MLFAVNVGRPFVTSMPVVIMVIGIVKIAYQI
jgi:hypothetical protein